MINEKLSAAIADMNQVLGTSLSIEETYRQLVQGVFKRELDNAPFDGQLLGLIQVATLYGVSPMQGEVYPHLSWDGSCRAVLTRDGWNRLAQTQTDYEGVSFTYSDETVTLREADESHPLPLKGYEWVEATVYRKGYHPFTVREHLDEVFRTEAQGGSPYWMISPKRMHRYKAFIFALRSAYSLGSIAEAEEMTQAQPQPVSQEAESPQASPESVAEKTEAPAPAKAEAEAEKGAAEPTEAEKSAISEVLQKLIARCEETGEWQSSRAWVYNNPKIKGHVKAYMAARIDDAQEHYESRSA